MSFLNSRVAILPMLNSLLRQKYALSMLVLQIAVTLAVISNGLFIVSQRMVVLQQQSGIDEVNTFVLTSSGFTDDFNPQNSMLIDLAELRQMPNIINAVASYSFPFSGSSDWDELQTIAGDNQTVIPAASYKLDEHGIQALGLTLIAGQNFSPSEVLWQTESAKTLPSVVIITRSVAQNLFNTSNWASVIGQTIYINKNQQALIKGIVEQLQAPWVQFGKIENSIIYPRVITRNSARYLIRVKPTTLNSSMHGVAQYLALNNQQRMIRKVQSISSMKKQVYGPDVAAISILLVVISSLIIVAALGIAGMASFNLLKRQKQIGIRRALGANKVDILKHFLFENVLQTTLGVLIGCILAVGLNIFLVAQYAQPKLPINYIFLAVLNMYTLGILATLKPAIKAMSVSPAEATRSN